ncbi:hypothetical protein ABB37_06503 [Leptomonas pyrrhocoris]|uniref:MYND-type domain-containing protein n=1 Tax=Leptomonas pyrrhocoris TaxID=157538 RepID=A0A0M9FY71_LEPPY|nr:hypothetical protein ABB37_06503 [Leptomonas pyrrhocoris]KPA78393.1 hypothetical protein ABB37_06503 [Leptomonas pyrrhocoris]|eukprot:XP_015656832.1 hypothetical protein ABB37_06503 [Leptomonas pyrrhocoris]
MNVSREEEHSLESQIADLQLSALKALVYENCAHNRRMHRDLEEIKAQVQQLLQRSLRGDTRAPERPCASQHPINEHAAACGSASVTSSSLTPCAEDGVHMCDYCFTFSPHCFPCPHCGCEWYCSDVCQRLRQRCHAARCRACSHPQHEVVTTK